MIEIRVRRWMKIIGWCFAGSSTACLVGAVFTYVRASEFVKTAARTSGTVVRLVEGHSSDSGTTFHPVFVFRDSNKREHEIYSTVGSYPPAYKVGEGVPVLYQAEDPDNASVDGFFNLWLMPFVFGIICVVHLAAALILLVLIPTIWKAR
jgi:hypothetical protein